MGYLRQSLCVLSIALLAGCMEYKEDVHIHRDGSGRIELDQSYDQDIVDEVLEKEELDELREDLREAMKELSEHPEIKKAKFNDFRKKGMHHFVVEIDVKNYEFLEELMGGAIRFEVDKKGKSGRYVRSMDDESGSAGFRFFKGLQAKVSFPRKALEKSGFTSSYSALGAVQKPTRWESRVKALCGDDEDPFKDKFITFHLHAPKVGEASEPGTISGGAVEWKFPLDGDAPPRELAAKYSLSSNTWMWLLLGALLLLASSVWFRGIWKRGILRRVLQKRGVL